jgi:hypothetical protein
MSAPFKNISIPETVLFLWLLKRAKEEMEDRYKRCGRRLIILIPKSE